MGRKNSHTTRTDERGSRQTRLYPEDRSTSTYLVALDGRELGTVTAWRSTFVGGRRRTRTWQARAANFHDPADL
ncbi:MAG TPA: hypothetical protein VE777_11320, partial [Gaiellales bacterium]|nr:hypothetical protein [Gaiellales bacterium]